MLDFLLKQHAARNHQPLDERTLYFGCYALSREDAVLLSMPLFELVLVRLNEGDTQAKQLADALLTNLGLPR